MTAVHSTVADEATSMNSDQTKLLHIYLRNHEAAAAGGVQLVRRCAKANRNTVFAAELSQLTMQLHADRAALQGMCRSLGVKTSTPQRMMAVVGVAAGRLKLNGRLLGYSPLSRIVELEALSAGVVAKLRLWQSLSNLADHRTPLDGDALRHQIEDAKGQLDTIARLHAMAVDAAFE
jgi:hypothetical protein